MTDLSAFKNQLTLDGKIKPTGPVTIESVKYVKNLFEQAQAGSYTAEARLKELFTTSDAAYSMAHLLSIQTIPNLPAELEEYDGIMGKRVVPNFNPVVLRQLLPVEGVAGAGVGAYGEAAVVPEGHEYPIVTFSGDQTAYDQKLLKRGFRFDFTLESWVNDLVGELEQMPDRMLTVTKKTILADFWEAVNSVATQIGAVTLPDGTTTLPNPALSAEGIIAAVVDIENRTINGNKIGAIGSYNVFVPQGQKRFLEYSIAQFGRVISVQDGSLTLGPDAEIQALFPRIRIIETARLTGTAWKIIPVPGSTLLPVVERLILRGYENPEIRVKSDQGLTLSGGKIGPFSGSYGNDSISLRFRLITGAALWFSEYIGASDGDGVA